MTNAQFCDIHPDQATSLIRGDKKSVTELTLTTKVVEVGQDGKKVTWNRETKIHACAKCVSEKILKPATALGVEFEYDEWRLTKDENGYHRITRDVNEAQATQTPLAK